MAAAAHVFALPWLARNDALLGRVIPFEDRMGLHAVDQSTDGAPGITPDPALPEPSRSCSFADAPCIGPVSTVAALADMRCAPLRYPGSAWGARSAGGWTAWEPHLTVDGRCLASARGARGPGERRVVRCRASRQRPGAVEEIGE